VGMYVCGGGEEKRKVGGPWVVGKKKKKKKRGVGLHVWWEKRGNRKEKKNLKGKKLN
jgi:hypothetical protein